MNSLFKSSSWETVLVLLGIFAGFVRASQRILRGDKIHVIEVLAHSVISAFSCLMSGLLLKAVFAGAPTEVILFLSGMVGYLGIAGLALLFETFLKRRL